MNTSPTIAILGGTGAEGSGLARRFAHGGARVLIGSRDAQRSRDAAARIHPSVTGLLNSEAVEQAEIVILAVPIQAQIATLKSVRQNFKPGTMLVDASVPLEIAIGGRLSHPLALWAGSAAEQAARNVPAGVAVVSAFHLLSADLLSRVDTPLDSDVPICGDDAGAKAAVTELVGLLPGARAIDAGPLENARLIENAAALLVSLNLRYKSKQGGIRITGLKLEN
ncbi:MAG TPA: NADPH-dependent F420 reductase [Bryobacteraceae bacterium]|nr:NADPH-dependent F420 reductase [Bryobacteraceae bacterium]